MNDQPFIPASKTKTITAPGKVKIVKSRKTGTRLLQILLFIVVIAAIGLFGWAEAQRRSALQKLQETSAKLEEVQKSTQRNGADIANEVLAKVRKHIDIPVNPAPTVATIVDVERLKQANEFYKAAKNGDHLIITDKRAILYDPDRDIIIDVVPVVIDKNASPAPSTPAAPPVISPAISTPAVISPKP
jgi:hypothetical protein